MATLFISTVGQAGIVWYLIILAAAAYLASTYRDYARLKAFKGPWASGWTSLWLARTAGGGQANLEFGRLCEKYGMSIYPVIAQGNQSVGQKLWDTPS